MQEESFRRAKEVSDKFREFMDARQGLGSARAMHSRAVTAVSKKRPSTMHQ